VGLKTAWWMLIGTVLTAIAPTIAIPQGYYEPYSLCSVQPTVRIGYLFPNRAASLSFDTSSGSQLLIQDFRLSINVRGVWTEVAVPVRGFGPIGLVLGFSYFFPSNKYSQETYELSPPGNGERDWTSSTQLWNIQAAITYNIFPSVNALVGFRYDSMLTNLKNPEGGAQVGGQPTPLFAPEDAADLSFSGYIPFLGLQMERTLPNGISLKAGVSGFPALPGAFEYVETVGRGGAPLGGNVQRMKANDGFRSGYFLEALAELSVPIYGSQMGAFVKYSGVYAKTNADVTSYVGIPGFLTTAITSYHNNVSVQFERSSWIVGGSVSFSFRFP
jgi:hypothetical protein